MALVLLIRHATTQATGIRLSGWTPGLHLDDRGLEQAETLASRLDGVPLAAVYTSPLERCVETAAAIAGPRGLKVEPVDALGEVRYGTWTGRPLRSLIRTKLWGVIQRTPSLVRFPGGETLGEVQARSVDAIERIAGRHPKRVVAVCSHADVIRLLIAHFAGVHLDLYQRTSIHPASVSAVALGGGPPRILRVNDTGTLKDLAPRRAPRGKRTQQPRRTGSSAARGRG